MLETPLMRRVKNHTIPIDEMREVKSSLGENFLLFLIESISWIISELKKFLKMYSRKIQTKISVVNLHTKGLFLLFTPAVKSILKHKNVSQNLLFVLLLHMYAGSRILKYLHTILGYEYQFYQISSHVLNSNI